MSDTKKPPVPNLDLIQMVQRARMLHDAQAKPSEVSAVYWIEAKNPHPAAPQPTANAGEWVIETTVQQVDALWEIIKTATERGELGYKSKVSTASRTDDATAREIRVRTANADDQADVERVRLRLTTLLKQSVLRYQRDTPTDTHNNEG